MRIPEEIRKVERPPGTVVYVYGKGGDRYGVKKRIFTEVNGKVVQRDGPTIGSIVNGVFVPRDTRPRIAYAESDVLHWADVQLIYNLTADLREDLLAVYSRKDAMTCYAVAVLRALEGGLKDDELKDAYGDSYLQVLCPDVALSKDTVGAFLEDLGRTYGRVTEFMRRRAARIPENHYIAVDGMLKSDESDVNGLSEFSRKALKAGTRDVSVVLAFDVDEMEPVCSTVYPGNVLDITAFRDFLATNGIAKGVIIGDKGFTYNAARQHFLDNPGLSFILPLKRSAKVIREYRALAFDTSLSNRDGVQARKVRMHDGRWLYSFRDVSVAKAEEASWTNSHSQFDPAELAECRKAFGTITFVSNLDAPPEFVYSAYEERWEIEVVFRFYKNILEMDETRVHGDYSLLGTEFVNLLSVICTCRLRKAFLNCGRISRVPFTKVMRRLRRGIMIRDGPGGKWRPKQITPKDEALFIDLGIIKVSSAPEKGRRGRPRKNIEVR